MIIRPLHLRPFTRLTRVAIAATGLVNIFFVSLVLYKEFVPIAGKLFEADNVWQLGLMTQLSVGILFSALGIFIVGLAGHRRGVLVLAGFLVSQGLAIGFLMGLGRIRVDFEEYQAARILINWLAYSFGLRTVQLFPRRIDRRGVTQNRPVGVISPVIAALIGPARVWIFTAIILAIVALTDSELLFHVGQLSVIAIVVLTMSSNYRLSGPRTRRKIYWLLLGTVILLLARIYLSGEQLLFDMLDVNLPGARSFTWALANVGLACCILFAVFYRGAVNPRTVMRRAAVYSLGFGALLFLFAAFENYASGVITAYLGIERGATAAIGGAATALMLKPVIDLLTRIAESVLPKI